MNTVRINKNKIAFLLLIIVLTVSNRGISSNSIDSVTLDSSRHNLYANITDKLQNDIRVDYSSTDYNSAIDFIKKSQDDGKTAIKIMDHAFYIGNIIRDLQLNNYTDPALDELINAIFLFVEESRNANGGYANWANGTSSMESTYQAIELYNIYGRLSDLSSDAINQTLNFINKLLTVENGYFPLEDWDVPDMTSTYRALYMQDILGNANSINVSGYISGNYLLPFFLNAPSGYAEITNGKLDLLATNYALKSYNLINYTETHQAQIANYLNSLVSLNGGIAGSTTGRATIGYTNAGIELYYSLEKQGFNMSSVFDVNFIDNAFNFVISNKLAGTAFSSSSRDSTPSLSSTYFALELINLLRLHNYTLPILEYSDIARFITVQGEISYGVGNYPGDIADLSYTTRAILTGRTLDDLSWVSPGIDNYLLDTYDWNINGFGFRPGSDPTVKYTYYGIKALRAFNYSLPNARDIANYLLSTQNPDGMFGKKPNYQLSYITYTYWALSALKMLNYLNNDTIDSQQILNRLKLYRNIDTGYSNFPGSESSIISTYRALRIRQMLGDIVDGSDQFVYQLDLYKHQSGGYIDRLSKTIPTMESTYYGLQIAEMLGIDYNKTQIIEFIGSFRNNDGGYATKPGFSSRLTATYLAVTMLTSFENENKLILENTEDIYSPLIYPAFNPKLDSNETIAGTYTTSAIISDPESDTIDTWIEVKFYGNTTYSYIFNGTLVDENSYSFTIGPFGDGLVEFRIVAIDNNGNIAFSDWFLLNSVTITEYSGQASTNLLLLVLKFVPLVALVIASIDVARNFRKRGEKIRMSIDEEIENYKKMNMLYLTTLMVTIVVLSRTLLGDAILVLSASTFLFQYLFASVVILFLRYVVGLPSYGYFGPAVIAISWLNLGLFWGFFLFINLFLISFLARYLIQPFGLPVGFRIGTIMIFLISTMTMMEVIGEIYRIDFLSGPMLIPILITPWMADRYINDMYETNQLDAFTKFISTLIIIASAYAVMTFQAGIVFMITNPETWIILLFVVVYFGRSRLYTYFDKRRFARLFTKDSNPLTMISRNRDYLSKYNQKELFPFINKFSMKEQFDKWKVPTAKLLAVIDDEREIDKLAERLKTEEIFANGFVIKPSESYGGKGIIVIRKREGDNFLIGGQLYHVDALKKQIKKIIQGEYLTSQTAKTNDIVIIEEIIETSEYIAEISIGLADIRVIVFQGIPVMAMMRLPTEESDGKANLKQGAIGAGIDMRDGNIIRAEYKTVEVNTHPDTFNKINEYRLDNWKEILAVAFLAQKSTNLGYAGVDLVIDKNGKVLVLEINKRPGLEIQNINMKSLLDRLKYVEDNKLNAIEFSPLRAAQMGIDLSHELEESN